VYERSYKMTRRFAGGSPAGLEAGRGMRVVKNPVGVRPLERETGSRRWPGRCLCGKRDIGTRDWLTEGGRVAVWREAGHWNERLAHGRWSGSGHWNERLVQGKGGSVFAREAGHWNERLAHGRWSGRCLDGKWDAEAETTSRQRRPLKHEPVERGPCR
jgi:hypothetical protein